MGSSDFGSLSVGPSQDHSQWSCRRRHRHRCATVPDSHRVHRDLIGAAPCTRRRLAPVTRTSRRAVHQPPCHRHAGSRAAHASEPTERDRRGTSHPRGNSVRQGTSCHARWQASRSLTDLPQTQTNHAPPQTGSPHRAGNPLRLSLTLQTRLRKLQCESQCGLQSAVPQRADTDRHSKAITTKSCTPTHTSCPKYNFTNTKLSTRLLAGSAAKPMRNGPKSHTWAPNPGRDHNFPVKKLWASPTTRRYAPAFRNIRTSPRHVATRHFTPAW